MNQIIISGNVVKDPETFDSGKTPVVKFALANERHYGQTSKVTFAPMVAFGKSGEALAKHVKKGTPLIVRGTLNQESWRDKDDNPRSRLSVIVDSWEFFGPKRQETQSAPADSKPQTEKNTSVEEDEIPF